MWNLIWGASSSVPCSSGGIGYFGQELQHRRTQSQVGNPNPPSHGGHWISDARGGALDQLLLGLTAHCLLLENATGEVLVLLPATGRPLPVASGVHLLHGDAGWLANLHPSVRHYTYAAHPSGAFLTSTTLGSSLYLLVCYLFMPSSMASSVSSTRPRRS